jgi:hypothetical protein
MKRTMICLALAVLFVGVASGQTRSLIGTVIDAPKGMYAWAAIVIKVGNKKYYIPTLGKGVPTQRTKGVVDEVGRTVRVFYTKSTPKSDGYDSELKAIKIVEVKGPKHRN